MPVPHLQIVLGECDACAELLERRQARVQDNLVVLQSEFGLDRGFLDLLKRQIEFHVEPRVAGGFQFFGEAFDAVRQRRGVRVAQEVRCRPLHDAFDLQMFFVLAEFGNRCPHARQLQAEYAAGLAAYVHVVAPENGFAVYAGNQRPAVRVVDVHPAESGHDLEDTVLVAGERKILQRTFQAKVRVSRFPGQQCAPEPGLRDRRRDGQVAPDLAGIGAHQYPVQIHAARALGRAAIGA